MARCKSMRHIVAGGEALTPALAARIQQYLPGAHLHNTYGPTEATIDITGPKLPGTWYPMHWYSPSDFFLYLCV